MPKLSQQAGFEPRNPTPESGYPDQGTDTESSPPLLGHEQGIRCVENTVPCHQARREVCPTDPDKLPSPTRLALTCRERKGDTPARRPAATGELDQKQTKVGSFVRKAR